MSESRHRRRSPRLASPRPPDAFVLCDQQEFNVLGGSILQHDQRHRWGSGVVARPRRSERALTLPVPLPQMLRRSLHSWTRTSPSTSSPRTSAGEDRRRSVGSPQNCGGTVKPPSEGQRHGFFLLTSRGQSVPVNYVQPSLGARPLPVDSSGAGLFLFVSFLWGFREVVQKPTPLLCRSVAASFQQNMDLKGIQVYRFTLQPDTLAAPTDNPDNQCFCRDHHVNKNCTLAGALDISSCQQGTRPRSSGMTRPPPLTYHLRCRKTHLHLAAPLPLRQPRPAGERAGPDTQRGASHDVPGRGAGGISSQC